MCGIAGVLDQGSSLGDAVQTDRASGLERLVQRMARAITHRGPDGEGHWVDAEHGIALAHRRLSIVDLSERGRQPMVTDDERNDTPQGGHLR